MSSVRSTAGDIFVQDLMLSADRVAYVGPEHTLDHALLILSTSGYTAIPVLNRDSKVCGIINTNMIVKGITGLDDFKTDILHDRSVAQVMTTDVCRVSVHEHWLKALELSVNRPFLCVEHEHGEFAGILTRRALLGHAYQQLRNHEGHRS